MTGAVRHFRSYVLRGLLTLIPLGLTALVLYLVYTYVDRQAAGLLRRLFGTAPPGVGLLAVLLLLYVTGLVASNVVGRWLIRITERVAERVPLLGATWRVGRQIAHSLSLPEGQLFRRVVIVPYLREGQWTVGFVTGTVRDEDTGQKLLKVYIPTPPNPTSGTIVLVLETDARDPGWTVEEALQTVISGGLIGPVRIAAPAPAGEPPPP